MVLTNTAPVQYITFGVFPVGYPHWADTVRLRGKVLEVDHHRVSSLGHDHRALNACKKETIQKINRTKYSVYKLDFYIDVSRICYRD